MTMSESELSQLKNLMGSLLDERGSQLGQRKSERWFVQGVMFVTLAVVMFAGKQVWDIKLDVATLIAESKSTKTVMADRFTGTQGAEFGRRILENEKEIDDLHDKYTALSINFSAHEKNYSLIYDRLKSQLPNK